MTPLRGLESFGRYPVGERATRVCNTRFDSWGHYREAGRASRPWPLITRPNITCHTSRIHHLLTLESLLHKILVAFLFSIFLVPGAAAQADDVTAPIHQFIDGFNTGNTKSAYAAYAAGNISITDEFAPHLWTGPDAARAWAADYDKHAKATGVTDGTVKYGEPTRKQIEGNLAYVVVPTVYDYKEHGKPTEEEGQMTFVLRRASKGWKISSWTWTGVNPHPAK